MLEVVFVHVGIHRGPGERQPLVILRARQRRQAEELQQIERQFALDDLDVAHDALGRVGGKAEDVAGIGEAADLLPFEQHFAIFGDAVLLFPRADEAVRIDVLEPQEHAPHAGGRRLRDEIRDAMDERVDLDDEDATQSLALAQFDQPVEDRLPVLVAREIVVGDEEMIDALGDVGAHDRLDIVGRSIARLAALHVDDGAERTLERTAAPRIETGDHARRALDARGRQDRHRRAFDPRQVGHEIIERPQAAREGVAQHDLQPALRLAREQRDADRLRLFQIVGQVGQHRDAARDMEAADGDLGAAAREIGTPDPSHAETGWTGRRPDRQARRPRRRWPRRSARAGRGCWSRR